jgi:hypothetical protein
MRLPSFVAAAAVLAALATPAVAASTPTSFVVDFGNIASFGEKGDADNTTLSFAIGAGVRIVGLTWDVEVSTVGDSWLDEISLDFTNTLGAGVQFSPALGLYGPGTHSSSGNVDLLNAGQSFALGGDGRLHLEFYESYDDIAGAADARWTSGSLSFQLAPVPEPSTYAMLGLGLLAVASTTYRRRRSKTD